MKKNIASLSGPELVARARQYKDSRALKVFESATWNEVKRRGLLEVVFSDTPIEQIIFDVAPQEKQWRMPAKPAAVFHSSELMSYREMSAILGTSPETIRIEVNNALSSFVSALHERNIDAKAILE